MTTKQRTVKEAARILGVSKSTIHAYIKGGRLSSKRKGGRTYVLDNEVQALKKKSDHWGWLLKKMRFFCTVIKKFGRVLKRYPKTSIVTLVVPLVALLLQYLVARPHIIVSKIKTDGKAPFKHEFVVTNSGMTTAYGLDIIFFEPCVQLKNGTTILPANGAGPWFKDLTKIPSINIAPDEEYSFSPDVWLSFHKLTVQKALINLRFIYTDLVHLFHYEDEGYYCLVSEGDKIVWKAIGPKERQRIRQEYKAAWQ